MKIIVMSSIIAIIGVILVGIIGSQVTKTGQLTTTTNDTFTASNASCVQITTGCIDSVTLVQNASEIIHANNYTTCSYNSLNKDGIFLLGLPTAAGIHGTTLNATYIQSTDCMYVKDSTSRTLVNLVPLFFILALLAAGIYFLYRTGLLEF